ncbi:MAG TPA: cysteine-rich CWC family protein [Xanthobacteraceae bacterium]|nr:cysteine-rich CWC family protein [Xanthobacteraceae bacterium]
METAERRLICESCGEEFGCTRDNVGACWCNAELYRLPFPAPGARAADCLCPACLRRTAAALKAASGLAGQG